VRKKYDFVLSVLTILIFLGVSPFIPLLQTGKPVCAEKQSPPVIVSLLPSNNSVVNTSVVVFCANITDPDNDIVNVSISYQFD